MATKVKKLDKETLQAVRSAINTDKRLIEKYKKFRKNHKSTERWYKKFTLYISNLKRDIERHENFLKGYFANSVKKKTIKTQKQRKNK